MNTYSATVGYDTTELDIRAAANLVAKEGSVVYVSLGAGARTLLDSSESYKVYPDVGDQNYVAVSVEYTEDGVTVINTYTIQVTRSPQSSEDIAILSSINAYDINGTVNVGGVDLTGSAVTEPLSFDALFSRTPEASNMAPTPPQLSGNCTQERMSESTMLLKQMMRVMPSMERIRVIPCMT